MFNLARRKKEKEHPDTEMSGDRELEMEILDTERRFQEVISPAETYIMMTQSILVWENPKYTSVFFVCANILFWLATTTRIYHLIGLTGLVLVFADMWTSKIWPEIRVPAPEDEDAEGWTPVYPRLLSVPEICHSCASIWVTTSHRIQWLFYLRKNHHAKFFFLMVIVLGSGAVLGTYISGITLLYIIVMCCLLLPGVAYHQLIQKAFHRLEPVIHRVEKSFNVKRKKIKRVKRRDGHQSLESSRTELESDSDLELQELLPSFEAAPSDTSLLHITPQTDDESATGMTPGRITPADGTSACPSTDFSDDENSLLPTHSMPRFDDSHLDESFSDHEQFASRLEVPDLDNQASDSDLEITLTRDGGSHGDASGGEDELDVAKDLAAAQQAMLFRESHFKEESSDSDLGDEAHLLQGLSIPDVDDESVSEQPEGMIGQLTQQMAAAVSAETVSSLMSSTMYGLSKIQETVRGAVQGTASTSAAPPPQEELPKGDMADSLDSDILADFDFLDDEDMGSDDDLDGNKSQPT